MDLITTDQNRNLDTRRVVKISLMGVGDGLCRVDYGDEFGGSYILVAYDDIRDYVLSKRPKVELLDIYPELKGG